MEVLLLRRRLHPWGDMRPLGRFSRITLGLLFLGALTAPLFVQLGRWPLVDPDEGRNAEVAREMLVAGRWVVPHFDGVQTKMSPALGSKPSQRRLSMTALRYSRMTSPPLQTRLIPNRRIASANAAKQPTVKIADISSAGQNVVLVMSHGNRRNIGSVGNTYQNV